MMGIARNLAMNEIRKNKKLESELEGDPVSPSDQFSHCEKAEKLQVLEAALNRLSCEHREILDLVFLQGMGYEDIAQMINIPLNTVKTRVFYAKEKLRTIITRMGIEKDDLL
jgi:RNA polymerase sigma-70 factor (ECF subfamily)